MPITQHGLGPREASRRRATAGGERWVMSAWCCTPRPHRSMISPLASSDSGLWWLVDWIARVSSEEKGTARTQGGVDLVHDVQRRRLVVVQREYERQRRQRLLAAAQVGDVLPALLRRAHAEHDALRPCATTGIKHAILFKFARSSVYACAATPHHSTGACDLHRGIADAPAI